MTIDEAVKMLECILEDRESYAGGMGNDAIKLGIEALKRLKLARKEHRFDRLSLLLGETKN